MTYIPSNINEMMQNIYRDSLIYSNRYEVLIDAPRKMVNVSTDITKTLTLRCNSVSVPGRSLTTQNYRFYGPQRTMPYEPLYSGDLSVSYILSGDLRERTYFENWMDFICKRDNYKFSFYDDYTTTITVNVLDKTDTVVYSAIVEEVYPKQIGELTMGYDKDNEYMTQDIIFAYRKYTPQNLSIQAPPYIPSPNPSPQTGTDASPQQSPYPNQPPLAPNTRDSGPQQWFELNPLGGLIRRGANGTVNGIINGR